MMFQTRLWAAALIIAAIIIGGFALSVPRAREVSEPSAATSALAAPAVTLHDSFKKGVHTIAGSVLAPDVCTTVSATAAVSGGASDTAIAIDIVMPPDPEVCLEEPSAAPFSVSIEAPANVPITASVNGLAASTTSGP